MVIAICKTKEEDTDTQILFWENLKSVMQREGFPNADFAGFMGDEAGANWSAIRTVFNGDFKNILEGRERSCLFHWEKSLQKHTKTSVLPHHRAMHIELCELWRLSTSHEAASVQANVIKKWWEDVVGR